MKTTTNHNYGIKSWWKRKFLNGFLSAEVPLISIVDASLQVAKFLFLDSREKKEYEISHIASAVYVGYEAFDCRTVNDINKELPVIVYCSVGVRSDRIAKALLQAGFTNVQNLYGGLFEWVNNGLPVVDANEQPTENIHAYNRKFGTWLTKGNKVYG